jgi:hypothetical protein
MREGGGRIVDTQVVSAAFEAAATEGPREAVAAEAGRRGGKSDTQTCPAARVLET